MKYYILTSLLKLKVEYSATLSLKSEIMMTAVAEAGNGPKMVETAREDRGWWVTNDGGR
jgi:hypothetical protein